MLQWLVGLERLGHEVYFVEKAGWPASCFNPVTGVSSDDCAYGVHALGSLLNSHGLADRWCFVDATGRYHGLDRTAINDVFRSAALFIDHMRECEWVEEAAHAGQRVIVDGEPGYFQMQIEDRLTTGGSPPDFDHYYTVGLNIGSAASNAPTAGLVWRPILDPVVPSLFNGSPPPLNAAWTTVMSWQAHDPVYYKGIRYGQKDIEFERFFDLPEHVPQRLELAIAGRNTPRHRLEAAGWELRDSHAVTVSFDSWRDYIAGSLGEFSVAKNVFVATNSGFFSDRSAAYLASGRPVVMQDTGFSSHLPCGEGLFAVKTVEEAADAIERVSRDYAHHSRAARNIALEHLDAEKVLAGFLRELGV